MDDLKELLKNAKFKQSFKTRDGREAVFIRKNIDEDGTVYYFVTETGGSFGVNENGLMEWGTPEDKFLYDRHPKCDIVGLWDKPTISEEELDRLAKEEYFGPLNWPDEYHNGQYAIELVRAYKVGFKEAEKIYGKYI